jgi:hypothetical protein
LDGKQTSFLQKQSTSGSLDYKEKVTNVVNTRLETDICLRILKRLDEPNRHSSDAFSPTLPRDRVKRGVKAWSLWTAAALILTPPVRARALLCIPEPSRAFFESQRPGFQRARLALRATSSLHLIFVNAVSENMHAGAAQACVWFRSAPKALTLEALGRPVILWAVPLALAPNRWVRISRAGQIAAIGSFPSTGPRFVRKMLTHSTVL